MDKLDTIFHLQNELSKVTNKGNPRYPDTTGEKISALCVALIHEVVELQRETNWKWWKKPTPLNMDDARVECIDIWHFLIQVSLELGLTPKDIVDVYTKKNQVNKERQKDGY